MRIKRPGQFQQKVSKSCVLLGAAMFFAPSLLVEAAEVNLSSGLGYDNNPFRLNDSFAPDAELYWKNQADISLGELSPWFVDLRAVHHAYDDGRADSTSLSWGLGYEQEFGEKKHNLELSLNGRTSDRTYVSRLRGDVFAVGGVEAADRYDFRRINPRAEWTLNLEGRNRVRASIEYRDQRYEDFSQLGVSNLDYSSWMFDLGWRSYLNDKLRYELQVDYQQRDYDDRRARDTDGSPIVISDLEYQIFGLELKTRYRLAKRTYLYSSLGIGTRADNGGSYYDTDNFRGSVRLRHKTQSGSLWTLGVYYQDLEYDRAQFVTDIENDAEAPSSKGFRGVASYERPLGDFAGGKLSWFSSLRFYDFSSDNAIYEYDRVTLETGLELSLEP